LAQVGLVVEAEPEAYKEDRLFSQLLHLLEAAAVVRVTDQRVTGLLAVLAALVAG
jgi:hypothetical protein